MATGQTIQLERYSPDAKALVAGAQELADARKHAQVEPIHFLFRALERDRGVAEGFRRAGAPPADLVEAADGMLRRLPPSSSELAYLSQGMLDFLTRAEKEARGGTITVFHLLNALSQEVRGAAADVLRSFGVNHDSLRPHLSGMDFEPSERLTANLPYTTDWKEIDLRDPVEPVVLRGAELRRVVQILARRERNLPLLVGETGVGKTAIFRGLAQKIVADEVPGSLAGLRIAELETGALLAGTRLRSEVEERLGALANSIRVAAEGKKALLLYVRNLDSLFAQGSLSALIGDFLKSILGRGDVRILAGCTPEGLRKIEERDPTSLRYFTAITILPPTAEETTEILRVIAARFEAHHKVEIGEPAIVASVRLAKRYLVERVLPDAAIDLLDEACARRRIATLTPEPRPVVTEEDVAQVAGERTAIPVSKMLEGEADKLLKIEDRLAARVVGQDEAVRLVARAVRRGRVGLRDPKKPIGSFLFLGPSGVGKTELAKALAEFLFDDEKSMIRLDMSEFMEKHMAQRLVGSPPGYVDSEEGGFLTEAVRRRPYSVILFDEIEKAHADVFNLLLQLLDDGRLTDGRGRTADFSNAVVILTSNIGSEGELRHFLRPEFLNRIDDVVLFRSLSKADLRRILEIQLGHLEPLLHDRDIKIQLTDLAKDRLVDMAYDPAFGARPLKRAIVRELQDPLAERILAGDYRPGSTAHVDAKEGGLVFAKG